MYSVHELTLNIFPNTWYAWLFVDNPYTVFTKRTLCLALNCKMKFIFFHILWTLRILININKISDNEESIKQWYHNITFVSPCINTVKYVQYILGINICTEQNKIKWKGRASNIKSHVHKGTLLLCKFQKQGLGCLSFKNCLKINKL